MKKHLISISERQDIVLTDLSKELGIPLSELIRRGLDVYIETLVEDGSLVKFTWTAGDKSMDMETPKESFKKLHDYCKNNPNGVLKLVENEKA